MTIRRTLADQQIDETAAARWAVTDPHQKPHEPREPVDWQSVAVLSLVALCLTPYWWCVLCGAAWLARGVWP